MTDLQLIKISVQRLKAMGFGSQKEIGNRLGYTNESAFSQVLNGKVNIPGDLFDRISALDNDIKNFINENRENTRKSNPRIEAEPLYVAADPFEWGASGAKFEELPNGMLRFTVKVVPYKGFAGYLRGYQDPEYFDELKTTYIDVTKEYRSHYLAFEVRGDSMTTNEWDLLDKNILDGWTVVGRELAKHHWKYKLHIGNNDAWVIVHRTEGILIKNIIKHDVEKAIITIHSLNPKYKDEDYSLNDIEQIFNIVKRIPPD